MMFVLFPTIPLYLFHTNFNQMIIVILTLWVFQTMYIENEWLMHFLVFVLFLSVIFFFLSDKWMIFYVLFEFSLVPIFLIILFFGYQPEKLMAGQYLLLYTIITSLPLLLYIIKLPVFIYTLSYGNSAVLFLVMTAAFMVKTPMYLVHIWLPKAHVEAPVCGSMVLAGVLLKMGSWGLVIMAPFTLSNLFTMYISISLLGSIFCSLVCLRSWDMKSLIAYSSVVHMSLITYGVFSGYELGLKCAFLMIVAHGVVSPLLFAFAYDIYCSSHSRLVNSNKGLLKEPISVFFLFMLLAVNFGLPPSVNIWSEILAMFSLIQMSFILVPGIILSLLVGFIYNIYLYVSLTQQKETFYEIDNLYVFPHISGVLVAFMLTLALSFF
uniref:NADH-ubiquinone oxidoreductase chain 4 n=1 Tax=Decipisagitta decipiens TaxID=366427 RepID=D3DKM5_9BILA|nr:NADH dehydrogenase subunit 4 [Decipisagitta decipiens]BAI68174.1 NADH dehydrogenase subunit 4 [Decipisagitta decipiens]